MSTEAAIVIIAVALVLITLLGWLAGRAENRRTRAASEGLDAAAVAPGYANEAAYAQVAREADQSLRSERDVVVGHDEDHELVGERDGTGRFAREDRVPRRS